MRALLLLLGASAIAALQLPLPSPHAHTHAQFRRAPPPACGAGRQYTPADRITFIDGNNLMTQRKVTKGRDELAAKIAGCRQGQMVLVFDGREGEAESASDGADPRVVITRGSAEGKPRETADEWIIREIGIAQESYARIECVTADRALRRECHLANVKTINPSKWWRRYLPRLKGLKSDYRNAPKAELAGGE